MKYLLTVIISVVLLASCVEELPQSPQWEEVELSFTSTAEYENPYTEVEFWVVFTHSEGQTIVRPGFWDEDNTWKVRFASPADKGSWQWESFASDTTNEDLHGVIGELRAVPYRGNDPFIQKGLLRMSEGKRNVVHANGEPFLMVGDTPWGLPFRGTTESVTLYAQNRQERGFNTALLMTMQPDRDAKGPRSRSELTGFDVAFEDMASGHINEMNFDYFKKLDTLRNILLDHGIVPVFTPVFHGFGWKGLNVFGWNVEAEEIARYSRYLVARYGARQAMWLMGSDSDGKNKGVKESGEEVHQWDAYAQPTGLHYSPFDDRVPDWMTNVGDDYKPHMNRSFQDAEWLDFQWCQTGHGGEHLQHKVKLMFENQPAKAVANGEPTYEGIGNASRASGWWQGHEAWLNFTSGGTMGVVYGAGGLWNWKLDANESGWPDWANSNVSWNEAIELPGAVYVGYLSKALNGMDIADIQPNTEIAGGHLCLAKPGSIYIVYLPQGGNVSLQQLKENMTFRWFDPVGGEFGSNGNTQGDVQEFTSATGKPVVLIVSEL